MHHHYIVSITFQLSIIEMRIMQFKVDGVSIETLLSSKCDLENLLENSIKYKCRVQ